MPLTEQQANEIAQLHNDLKEAMANVAHPNWMVSSVNWFTVAERMYIRGVRAR